MAYHMKSGSSNLYDNATGDVVGFRDVDGGDQMFVTMSDAGFHVAGKTPTPAQAVMVRERLGMGVGLQKSNILTAQKSAGMSATAIVTAATTWHIETAMAAHFDSVRIGIYNNLNATATVGASVSSADTAGANNSAETIDPTLEGGAWTDCTFAGGSTGTLVACTDSTNPNILWSDWTSCTSLGRADSGVRPLLHIRLLLNGASLPTTPTITGFGTAWEDDATTGGRLYRVRQQLGNKWSVKTDFTETASSNIAPVIAIQYRSRVAGKTILSCGDSIALGEGATAALNGFTHRLGASSTLENPVEIVNLGWGSQRNYQYAARLAYIVENGIVPEVVVYAGWSPNVLVPMTASDYGWQSRGLAIAEAACARRKIPFVVWGVLPTDSTSKNWGASDSFRTSWRAVLEQGRAYIDVSDLVPVTVVGGQEIPSAGYFADGIHPNDALHQALADRISVEVVDLTGLP